MVPPSFRSRFSVLIKPESNAFEHQAPIVAQPPYDQNSVDPHASLAKLGDGPFCPVKHDRRRERMGDHGHIQIHLDKNVWNDCCGSMFTLKLGCFFIHETIETFRSSNASSSKLKTGNAMWNNNREGHFDAAVWKGQGDTTTVVGRLSMLLGLVLLWFGFVFGIFYF
jgi:hypothetical protein